VLLGALERVITNMRLSLRATFPAAARAAALQSRLPRTAVVAAVGGADALDRRRALAATLAAAAALAGGAPPRAAAIQGSTAGRIPGVTGPGADGLFLYTRPEGKSGGHGARAPFAAGPDRVALIASSRSAADAQVSGGRRSRATPSRSLPAGKRPPSRSPTWAAPRSTAATASPTAAVRRSSSRPCSASPRSGAFQLSAAAALPCALKAL
jgi:hypothetical protein